MLSCWSCVSEACTWPEPLDNRGSGKTEGKNGGSKAAKCPPWIGFHAAANGHCVTAHYVTLLGIWRGRGDEWGLTSVTGWFLCTFNVVVRGTEQGIIGRSSWRDEQERALERWNHNRKEGIWLAEPAQCKKSPRGGCSLVLYKSFFFPNGLLVISTENWVHFKLTIKYVFQLSNDFFPSFEVVYWNTINLCQMFQPTSSR